MHNRYYLKIVTIGLVISLTFSACGDTKEDQKGSEETTQQQQEEPEQLELTQNIIVDFGGYQTDSRKIILIRGTEGLEHFRVMDAATKEAVYTGELTQRRNEKDSEEYISYGDFSDWKTAGEYYIECDGVGYSTSFEVKEDLYTLTFDEVWKSILAKEETFWAGDEVVQEQLTKQISMLMLQLLSYELYPEVYEQVQQDSLPQNLDIAADALQRLSSFQNKKTGEIEGGEYAFAAVVAKLGYLLQDYDSKLSSSLQNQADLAWRFAEKNLKKKQDTQDYKFRFVAAAELYRLTGQNKYRNKIEEYGNTIIQEAKKDKSEKGQTVSNNQIADNEDSEQPYTLTGKSKEEYMAQITYLSTRKKVNLDICDQFMKELMAEAEDIAVRASQAPYYSDTDASKKGMEQLMWDVTVLSVVDYVITNHEYGQIKENQHHYLNGRNPQGYSYWTGESLSQEQEQKIQLKDEPEWLGAYLLMLSSIVASKV